MRKNIQLKSICLALLATAAWGSLYPLVKIGYKAFAIDSSSIPDILMFASVRFIVCGLIVCAFSVIKKEKLAAPRMKSITSIVVMGLFSIVLHYAFTYVGLSINDSAKTALIKQIGGLCYVCFSFLFFKEEKFSILKIIGAMLGFAGIFSINYSPEGITFSLGDILIIMASFCSVISGIITKKAVKDNSPFWITGISQLTGGVILLIAASVMGAEMLVFSPKAIAVFAYICIASISGYVIWYYVLRGSSLSRMSIIKFAEPLFACVFSAILLGEEIFKLQYLIAFVLISLGIMLGNKGEEKLA